MCHCTSAPVCATAPRHLCVPLQSSTSVVRVVCVPAVFHRLLAARLRAALTTTASAQQPSPPQQQQPQEQQQQQPPHGTLQPAVAGSSRPCAAVGVGSGGGASASLTLSSLSRELVDSCSTSQHTYLHAQVTGL